MQQLGFQLVFIHAWAGGAHRLDVAGGGNLAGAAQQGDLVLVFDHAHLVQQHAQVAILRRRARAGTRLRAHRFQPGIDAAVECLVMAQRPPQLAAVDQQFRNPLRHLRQGIGLVKAENLARAIRSVAETLPDLHLGIAFAAKQNGFAAAAVEQQHRLRLGKAGQVQEMAICAVGIVAVGVAHGLRRGGQQNDAITDLRQQTAAAGGMRLGHRVADSCGGGRNESSRQFTPAAASPQACRSGAQHVGMKKPGMAGLFASMARAYSPMTAEVYTSCTSSRSSSASSSFCMRTASSPVSSVSFSARIVTSPISDLKPLASNASLISVNS